MKNNSNQLQAVTNGAATYSNYTYNKIGDLDSQTPGCGNTTYLRYNGQGLVTGIYGDAAFTQPKITFTYNYLGQRVIKKDLVNNFTTYYISSPGGKTLAIYTQSGTGAITESL